MASTLRLTQRSAVAACRPARKSRREHAAATIATSPAHAPPSPASCRRDMNHQHFNVSWQYVSHPTMHAPGKAAQAATRQPAAHHASPRLCPSPPPAALGPWKPVVAPRPRRHTRARRPRDREGTRGGRAPPRLPPAKVRPAVSPSARIHLGAPRAPRGPGAARAHAAPARSGAPGTRASRRAARRGCPPAARARLRASTALAHPAPPHPLAPPRHAQPPGLPRALRGAALRQQALQIQTDMQTNTAMRRAHLQQPVQGHPCKAPSRLARPCKLRHAPCMRCYGMSTLL